MRFLIDECVSANVSLEENEHGLQRMPLGRRQRELVDRWQSARHRYSDAILDYTIAAAESTARTLADTAGVGSPMSHADAQIAGTCLAADATLATRNTSDFESVPHLKLVNPFDVRIENESE